MSPQRRNYQKVFVIKNSQTNGIIEDEIIEIETDRFKSIKFRHTYHQPGDFVYSMDEALHFMANDYKVVENFGK